MQITHEQARQWIQLRADEALSPQEETTLSTHLKVCFECRAYAEEIKEVENTLMPMLKRQWKRRPAPLSLADFKAKKYTRATTSNILAIRTALISLVFVGFVFSMWQFTRSSPQFPGLSTVIVSSVPTPSVESTNTSISSENCYGIRYTVQLNDTLTSIAERFSVSKDEIMASNHLKSEFINAGIMLMIPSCHFTPTGVVIETRSTTLTPFIGSATSSPEPTRY